MIIRQIDSNEYLMGRIKVKDLPIDKLKNMSILLPKINELLNQFGEYRMVVSGYRTPEINKLAGGAGHSLHMECAAIDLLDKDRKLSAWTLANFNILEQLGLYIEDISHTPNWVHYQIRAPKSGKRMFLP